MSRKRAASPSHLDDFDDDYCESGCSSGSRGTMPVQRNAANARERARMRVLSSAFCRLKTKLPWVPADTKLSKLDTLRLATIYIQQLRSSLATGKELYYSSSEMSRFDTAPSAGQNQPSLVWPFTFQQQPQHQTQHQSSEQQSPDSNAQNRSDHHVNWYDRDTPSNHYNVHFYSALSAPNAFEHDKYHQKNGIPETNTSMRTEHG